MAYKAVIFDLDGTLLDTLDDLHASVSVALEKNGFVTRSREEIRAFLGNGVQELIHKSVPEGTDLETEAQVLTDFKAHYAKHSAEKTKPYKDVNLLIRVLSGEGVMRAIVSNKPDSAAQDLAAEYFPGMFNAVVGERAGISRKPAPDTVNAVIERLGLSREDTVYVGDSEVDIETAKNAGIDCVCVSWGFRSEEQLRKSGAERIAPDAEKLAEELLFY